MRNLILTGIILCSIAGSCSTSKSVYQTSDREYYEIKVYHFTTRSQEDLLDQYLAEALIPGLHKQGIEHVGAFKPLSNDTTADKRIYLLTPGASLEQFILLPELLKKDPEYLKTSEAYRNAPHDQPPYNRVETIFLRAFRMAPHASLPNLKSEKSERIYELRSYESATEKLHQNKVHMFNEGGEISLFQRLGFNAVFYGEVVAGSRMPNLMYMTSFENMRDRETHWQSFREDSEWKKLSAMPKYQNNVSRNEQILTSSTPYSDF